MEFSHFFVGNCREHHEVAIVGVCPFELFEVFNCLTLPVETQIGHSEQIVEFGVERVVVESALKDGQGLYHLLAVVEPFCSLQQFLEIA